MDDLPGILTTLIQLIADVFMVDPARLSAASTAADVPGWDSVSQVMLVMEIEDAFNVALPTELLSEAANIGELAKLLAARHVTLQQPQ